MFKRFCQKMIYCNHFDCFVLCNKINNQCVNRLFSQTLLWNLKSPVKQGNPNTSSEIKLCLFFIYSGSRSSLVRD